MMEQIWIIKGKNKKFSDNELVMMIKQGLLNGKDEIATMELKKWIKIEDSIYQFYLKGDNHETI